MRLALILSIFALGVTAIIVGLVFVFWPLALIVGGAIIATMAALFMPVGRTQPPARRFP